MIIKTVAGLNQIWDKIVKFYIFIPSPVALRFVRFLVDEICLIFKEIDTNHDKNLSIIVRHI